ncbi:MAG: hypothetical protein AAGB07_15665 [Pseudomonadota bacterium]
MSFLDDDICAHDACPKHGLPWALRILMVICSTLIILIILANYFAPPHAENVSASATESIHEDRKNPSFLAGFRTKSTPAKAPFVRRPGLSRQDLSPYDRAFTKRKSRPGASFMPGNRVPVRRGTIKFYPGQ